MKFQFARYVKWLSLSILILLFWNVVGMKISPIFAVSPTPDEILEGDQDGVNLGESISSAGDVNGDGYVDVIVGLPNYDGDGNHDDEGAASIYYGGATGLLTSTMQLTHASDQISAHFGAAVSIAGDVNGDTYSDVIIGAPDYDGEHAGEGAVFLYYGGPTGLVTSSVQLVHPSDQEDAHFGATVSTAGDLNEDGYADVIVGAPDYDGPQPDAGAAFVYYGGPDGLVITAPHTLLVGDQVRGRFGAAVDTAGDVNSDGYADIIVGAPGYDITGTVTLTDAGQVSIHYGTANGLVTETIWVMTGDQSGARFGAAVSTAGDVNGDGYADIFVGAPDYDAGQAEGGAAFVYQGGARGPAQEPSWTITGDQAGARFGAAVSTAGDTNGDGYADVIVGAPGYEDAQPDEGAAFVYQGGPDGLMAWAGWSDHPTDQERARFGLAVAAADVNGDGHNDLLIGAPGYDHEQNDEGGVFVYRGNSDGLANAPLWQGAEGQEGALLGQTVAGAGDVNGDGYDDILVGAPRYSDGQPGAGAVFLYLGGAEGPAPDAHWIEVGDQSWAWFGHAIAPAGDINNDGYADLIVGAPRYDAGALDTGAAFVYYGGPTGPLTSTVQILPPMLEGTLQFSESRFGTAVSTAGDVNGDGYGDVIVTANGYDAKETNEGAAFVYHGGPTGLITSTAWLVHPAGQPYANFGRSAASAGDVDGDGYSDVIIGASRYNTSQQDEGAAFIYYGSSKGLVLTPTQVITGASSGGQFGISVASAGDVNGDGYSDVVVGAYHHTEVPHATHWLEGAAFVYHGGPEGLIADPAWRALGGQPGPRFGLSVHTAGDVNGDGYSDVAVGAPSYDITGINVLTDAGQVRVYHGAPSGLSAAADWTGSGDQVKGDYGFAVSAAGDVNGDGYGDLALGAPAYNHTEVDEGGGFVYLGGGGGLSVHARQMDDGHRPIAPLGRPDSANRMRLQLTARSPLGRGAAAMQWQVAPLGTPFTASAVITGTSPNWRDTLTTGVTLSQTVEGLIGGTAYRWRVRTLYPPGNRLGQVNGRWLHLPWNGSQETDFRTPRLLAPDRSAQVQPGQSAIYTHTLTNPIGEAQVFTLTAISSQGYTVTIATLSSAPTVTMPGFDQALVTVTVQVPLTTAGDAEDTTVVTATGGLSGHDAVRDVTSIVMSTAANKPAIFLPLITRAE